MSFYLPLAAANKFVVLSKGEGVSHMKLQKLVYLAHGVWLARHGLSFLSENPQVWQYGPVFGSMYHELKNNRSAPITELQTIFDEAPRVDDRFVMDIIAKVWDKFGSSSAIKLSDLTHLPGSPWHIIAKEHKFRVPMGTEIDPEIIGKYFRETASMAV
jgi:uncharacterized phage-associated protein